MNELRSKRVAESDLQDLQLGIIGDMSKYNYADKCRCCIFNS